MKVDAQLKATGFAAIEAAATAAQAGGYAGLWSAETAHDPFLPAVLAAAHTETVEIGTAIAVAFARNPMSLAATAHDLQVLSRGRFRIGVGSQVQAHIERRFSMPWSAPAARMRDFVLAMRAIWADWNEGTPLHHEGPFYRHTLMTPMFRPGASEWGPPQVWLAAVGERMVAVAGEVADGLIAHSFSTPRSLRERTIPTLHAAARAGGRAPGDIEVSLPLLVATGSDDVAMTDAVRAVRATIAFYASTPAYRWVLDVHGLGDVGVHLTELSRSADPGRWSRMGELVGDDLLHAVAVVAPPGAVARTVADRYGGLVDRVSLYTPYRVDPALITGIAREVMHISVPGKEIE